MLGSQLPICSRDREADGLLGAESPPEGWGSGFSSSGDEYQRVSHPKLRGLLWPPGALFMPETAARVRINIKRGRSSQLHSFIRRSAVKKPAWAEITCLQVIFVTEPKTNYVARYLSLSLRLPETTGEPEGAAGARCWLRCENGPGFVPHQQRCLGIRNRGWAGGKAPGPPPHC